MFDDVERTDHIKRHSKSWPFHVSLHQSAGSSFAGESQPLRKQIHPYYDSSRACLLERLQHIAGSAPHFQYPVSIAPVLRELPRQPGNHLIPRAKPEMSAFHVCQLGKKLRVVGLMRAFRRVLLYLTHKQTHALPLPPAPDLPRSVRYKTAAAPLDRSLLP